MIFITLCLHPQPMWSFLHVHIHWYCLLLFDYVSWNLILAMTARRAMAKVVMKLLLRGITNC